MTTLATHAVKTYGFKKIGKATDTTILQIAISGVTVGVVLTERKDLDPEAVAFRMFGEDEDDANGNGHITRIVQTSDDVWRLASDAATHIYSNG